MVRGIERRDIFLDDHDRKGFVQRLSTVLPATATRCFAWALMPNHVHLLLMPTERPLAELMRRLLTGHAVAFNKKYQRSGHLFQNRYKSIVCDEEPYLLELVRYIHLNPLRAGLVADLNELDRYPWSGHAAIMGRPPINNQEIAAVLARFGGNLSKSRRAYREFVADGVVAGRRDDLASGRCRESRGGQAEGGGDDVLDGRILGGRAFANSVQEGESLRGRSKAMTVPELLDKVCEILGLDPEAVRRPDKHRALAEARGIVCWLAIREMGYKGSEVGGHLHLGPTGVTLATRRGEGALSGNPVLKIKLLLQVSKSK